LPLLRAAATRLWPFALPLVAGFFLRLAVIPPSAALDVAPLIGDEGNYLGIAESLAAGSGIPDRWAWLRPPGYPLILAGLLRLAGGDLRAMLLAQAFAGLAIVLAAAGLAGQLWGRRAAILAAWWVALDPSLIYYTRILHAEVYYTALLALATLALVRYAAPGASWRPLAAGAVAIGLATLVRPSSLAAIPLLALWMALRRWRDDRATGVRHAILLVALVAAVIAPNAARNWVAYGRFIPTDTTVGYIFWLDHRDIAKDEVVATLSAIPNPGDRQAYALRQGLAWVAAHPGEAVVRAATGLRIFWGDGVYVTEAVLKRPGVADGWRYTVEALCLLNWLVLMPLAVVGASRARRSDPLIPVGLIAVLGPSIGVALAHPENRYMIPALPLLIAAASGVVAPGAVVARSRRRTLAAGAVVALFLLNCWLITAAASQQRLAIAGNWLLARGAERVGAATAARDRYAAMAAWSARLSEPDERLATLARARGDDDAALALALRAVERDGDNFRARALAAQIYRERGQVAELRQLAARTGPTTIDALDWAWGRTDPAGAPADLTFDGTDLGFVRGFYVPEKGEGGRSFRWLAGQGQVRLAPPPGAQTLALTLASPLAPDQPPLAVAVRANGRALGTVEVRRELGWNELRLPLPADLAGDGPLTVELSAPTVRFYGDRRAHGVAVARVAVEPAAPGAGARGETRGPFRSMLSATRESIADFRLRTSDFARRGEHGPVQAADDQGRALQRGDAAGGLARGDHADAAALRPLEFRAARA
jgi:4-amino-4-deoxy-L-arabinose transferase-like glycosyltransferase